MFGKCLREYSYLVLHLDACFFHVDKFKVQGGSKVEVRGLAFIIIPMWSVVGILKIASLHSSTFFCFQF